ncbi:hypothetical protein HPP92_001046 [Vanilla planifolia]|uniref:Auxin-responsive protein n=1 Tax=Vanilla planifolia TaxID=51239 RepID=A0A835RZ68_VANPL|nr:hypothetical protein HPP92_001046 [Vanilla planifolia]
MGIPLGARQQQPSFSLDCIILHSEHKEDLSTDLRLGLSLSTSTAQEDPLNLRENYLPDWPPIKPVLRSAFAERGSHRNHQKSGSFFVKVYMEGIPIGRKLDLFAHDGYESLIKSLGRMFRAIIIYPDLAQLPSSKAHVLTYEDKDGDWMMVGDVPWEYVYYNSIVVCI